MSEETGTERILVAAFYEFVSLDHLEDLRDRLLQRCRDMALGGTILLAAEGINGTIAGSEQSILRFFARLAEDPRFADVAPKYSWTGELPFHRMKVRLKKEIVTLGVADIDPNQQVGQYVAPEDWDALTGRSDVRLIDTRNRYEYHLGTFAGAEDPETDSFREFPQWVAENLNPADDKHVAMFCTGGIRCEKATAYLLQQGFEHVYHLQGGILNYLESVDPQDSTWQGDCFVFDNRVTVDHELKPGDYELCSACRMPLSPADKTSARYEKHVSCPKCYHRLTPERRASLLERAKQIRLAKQRGEQHIGNLAATAANHD